DVKRERTELQHPSCDGQRERIESDQASGFGFRFRSELLAAVRLRKGSLGRANPLPLDASQYGTGSRLPAGGSRTCRQRDPDRKCEARHDGLAADEANREPGNRGLRVTDEREPRRLDQLLREYERSELYARGV